MEPVSRPIDPLSAKLPAFSADWRFLLPIRPGSRMLVLTDWGGDFGQHFAGLRTRVVTWRAARPDAAWSADGASRDRVCAQPPDAPFASHSFDAVAVPLGIPRTLSGSPTSVDYHRGLKRLLKPGGRLLVGSVNGGDSRPSAFKRALERAGFEDIRIYGAVPNLAKPAYILPLERRSLQFFAHSSHLGRRAGRLLRLLSILPLSGLLRGLLPCYFVIGAA
ncbi:MAG: hypothetical protein ACM3QS_01890 [Bacteroidota bacterium]